MKSEKRYPLPIPLPPSHPSRVRGLKYDKDLLRVLHAGVAPFTGAWIEIKRHRSLKSPAGRVAPFTGAWIEIPGWRPARAAAPASHPSRVRGLKSVRHTSLRSHPEVAPFTGAWIEMNSIVEVVDVCTPSHPSRVRGLKCVFRWRVLPDPTRRTLHGCVD